LVLIRKTAYGRRTSDRPTIEALGAPRTTSAANGRDDDVIVRA